MEYYQAELEDAVRTRLEVDQHAVLAAWIISFLRGRFDDDIDAWPSREGSYGREVRNTCEAVEALHAYHPDSQAAKLVDDAISWLVNLPFRETLEPDARAKWLLHPTRFKTLATVGAFDSSAIRTSFRRLLREQFSEEGLDDGDAPQYLRACVLLETLQRLSRRDQEAFATPPKAQQLARLLRRGLVAWQAGQRKLNARDLSYMAALLIRTRLLRASEPLTEQVVETLNAELSARDEHDGTDPTHWLYAALQLAAQFRFHGDTAQVVRRYLRDLVHQYLEGAVWREKEVFDHALLLRILHAYHAQSFEDFRLRVISCMIRRGEMADRSDHQSIHAELGRVIHDRLEVSISDVDELSGGYTPDTIYKVSFGYGFHLGADDGEGAHAARKSSIVIKKSTEDAFLLATRHYQRLGAEVAALFARHPGTPQVLPTESGMSYFLMLEDLTNLMPFSRLFGKRIDLSLPNARSRILLDHSVENICGTLFTLFESAMLPSDAFPGMQLFRLYFARIEDKLTQAFVRTTQKQHAAGSANGSASLDLHEADPDFAALKGCLAALLAHADRLQPAMLGLVHGDFHSRNIMLDKEAKEVKLIDMDKLSWSGDYVADVGLLLMDVALYRRLVERHEDHSLNPRDIRKGPDLLIGGETSMLTYLYPAASQATQMFQERLMEQISSWAYHHDDNTWQERLWLATATAMLARVQYQQSAQLAALLYAEAVRLLHELAEHLRSGVLLPCVPFPYRDPQTGALRTMPGLPAWCREREVVQRVHELFAELASGTRLVGQALEYHVTRADGSQAVFATLAPAAAYGSREHFAQLHVRLPAGQWPAQPAAAHWIQAGADRSPEPVNPDTEPLFGIDEDTTLAELAEALHTARAVFAGAARG